MLSLVLMALPVVATLRPADAAASALIKFPFASGAGWSVLQGYNTSPVDGGSHYNCDPATLTDAPSHTQACGAQYQYKYSLDLVRADGQTTGQPVYSAVNGTIRWIDNSTGGMSIYIGSVAGVDYAFAFFHVNLAAGLAAGQNVSQGQLLGAIAPAGQMNNGGTAHVHIALWQTTDQGNWSRVAVPFAGALAVDGYSFPDKGATSKNQYQGTPVSSSNVPLPATPTPAVTATPTQIANTSAVPSAPTQTSPANGTTFQNTGITVTFTWTAVSGATGYQVSLDGDLSGWVSGTSWTSGTLNATGQYAWKVQAMNGSGVGAWSPLIVFWIDPTNGASCDTTGTPAAGTSPTLTTDSGSYNVGDCAQLTGKGFQASEAVNVYLDSTTTIPVAIVNAGTNGSFYASLTFADMPGGSHVFIAKGAKSAKQASAGFSIAPTIRRDPFSGSVGDPLVITGRGFGANESVAATFIGGSGPNVSLGSFTTDATGKGVLNTTFPAGTGGQHDYKATGATSNLTAWGAMNIYRNVYVNPSSGAPGASIALTATGFPSSAAVTATWNGAGAALCSGTTQSNGNFSCSISIPSGTLAGAYPVVLSTAGGTSASANVTVSGSAAISISISSGRVSSKITIAGGGFKTNSSVALTWDGASWVSVTANSGGAFSYPATVPNIGLGPHTLKASGSNPSGGAVNPSAVFTIATTGGDTGSRMTSYGTYAVTATIEGLVGGTTSNGHTITPLDHFVSLPSCTGTSCPTWSTGPATACGNACYVRVTNPATNQCSVAPVYDVGPWFTNDNWWDAPADRKLNNLAANPNYLAQGYPAAEANLDGLDVGYGPGISNVGYATGNRAAIDIADGTWVDIGIPQSAGIAPVVVTMLWQTGENYLTAMAACGQTVPGGTPTVTASATSGVFVGDQVTISGTGFKANETISIRRGATGNPVRATGTANSTGAFSIVLTIPPTTNGGHVFYATGSAGSIASVTISIAAQVVFSVSSGGANQPITVTATGFNGSDNLALTWAPGAAAAGSGATDINGSASFTATTPLLNGPWNGSVSGASASVNAMAAYTVIQNLTVAPTSGLTGSSATFAGTGWGANATITLFWNRTATSAGISICTTTTSTQGAFSCAVKIPTGYAAATYPVVAGSGALTASAPYTVTGSGSTPTPTPSPTSTQSSTPIPPATPDYASAYPLVSGASSASSQDNGRVRDQNLGTYWRTLNTGVQANAWVMVDLGSAKPIGQIQWWFGATGMAPSLQVQISSDNANWSTVTSGGNGAVGTPVTYALPSAQTARYVRFFFTNTNSSPTLGGIAEILVFPGVATPASSTPTPTPTTPSTPSTPDFTGAYSFAGGSQSGDSQSSSRARDRDMSTYWRTNNTGVKSSAWLIEDLGSVKSVGKIQWWMGVTGMANAFQVQLSSDGVNWSTVTTGTDSPVGPAVTYTLSPAVNARYVRFLFSNPNGTAMLGGIAEIALYPASGPAPADATSTPTSAPAGDFTGAYPLVGGGSSPDSQNNLRVRDQDLSTYWRTNNTGVKSSAYVYVDLGGVNPIGQIRWYMGVTGMAAAFQIQVSTDGGSWTTVATGTDSPAGTWSSAALSPAVNGRYVRFLFSNPNGTATLGGIAEISVYPGSASVNAAAATTAPASPTGTPTPTASATPAGGASPVPVETASPVLAETDTPTAAATETPTGATTETPTPTETPMEVPATETPTSAPTQTPTPVTTEVNALSAISAAPVTEGTPVAVAAVDPSVELLAGGPANAVAAISFDVEAIGSGKLVSATLVLTGGADGAGISNPITVLAGYVADNAILDASLLPLGQAAPATTIGGLPVRFTATPGVEARLDVTGSVAGDGAITFFITGTPDQIVAIAGQLSATPPRLEIVTQPAP